MPQHPDLLAEAEAFRLLFAYASDAILLVDPECHGHDPGWQIVACNDVAVELYGFGREELAGASLGLLGWDLGDPVPGAAALDRIRSDGALRGEAQHRRKDGA